MWTGDALRLLLLLGLQQQLFTRWAAPLHLARAEEPLVPAAGPSSLALFEPRLEQIVGDLHPLFQPGPHDCWLLVGTEGLAKYNLLLELLKM